MKLLFDQNLSPQLPHLLADIYAGSVHVREVGLRDADDLVILGICKNPWLRDSFERL
jgi:predicted nuclease of predicted toxin-antitoxin system